MWLAVKTRLRVRHKTISSSLPRLEEDWLMLCLNTLQGTPNVARGNPRAHLAVESALSFTSIANQYGRIPNSVFIGKIKEDTLSSWATFRPTKFKTHYIAPQFLHWNVHIFLFWLNPTGHFKFHNTSNHPPPATDSGRTARTPLYPPVQAVLPYSLHRYLCPWQACATTACSECAR